MNKPIYLDNHATTPLDPRVLESMLPFFHDECGNASSGTHCYGWKAKAAVDTARQSVAALIGAKPDEIVFTSGATESNNWVLDGILSSGDHVLSTAFEHRSILSCIENLRKSGVESTLIAPRSDGSFSLDAFSRALKSNTKLVTAMIANNEVGSILPVRDIAQIVHENGSLFHCDAVQGAGKIGVDVKDIGADFASLSAHKMYGPKGVGALYIRLEQKSRIRPLFFGGGHEGGLRAGTLNVAGIVGFGVACDLARAEMQKENAQMMRLRDRLWHRLQESVPGVQLNGSLENRLPGNLNVSFPGVDGEKMLLALQNDIAISASSACASTGRKNSHVLTALGIEASRIHSSFRIGIGRFNTVEDIDLAARVLCIAQAEARC